MYSFRFGIICWRTHSLNWFFRDKLKPRKVESNCDVITSLQFFFLGEGGFPTQLNILLDVIYSITQVCLFFVTKICVEHFLKSFFFSFPKSNNFRTENLKLVKLSTKLDPPFSIQNTCQSCQGTIENWNPLFKSCKLPNYPKIWTIPLGLCVQIKWINFIFLTNSNAQLLTRISLQLGGVNLKYFNFGLFDPTEFVGWNISGVQSTPQNDRYISCVSKVPNKTTVISAVCPKYPTKRPLYQLCVQSTQQNDRYISCVSKVPNKTTVISAVSKVPNKTTVMKSNLKKRNRSWILKTEI